MGRLTDDARSLIENRSPAAASETLSGGLARETQVGMIGCSPAFRALQLRIERIAATDAPVLIEGETGSGKELAARSIHYLGQRRDKPFVPVNCGAIPENLVEAELFGHVRGAFTDAKHQRAGLVAQAKRGTLFFDEIDAFSPKAQVTVLRFLEDHSYRRVGNDQEQFCDVRIVAATNRPLRRLVEEGSFRRDLLYRLNVLTLTIPPLRDRSDDIELLAAHYLQRFRSRYDLPARRLRPETLQWMLQHDWPGNVRELENLVHRLVLLVDDADVSLSGSDVAPAVAPARINPRRDDSGASLDFRSAKARAVEEFERGYLSRLMTETRGNVSAAARLARKERRALGKLLKKHSLDPQLFRY